MSLIFFVFQIFSLSLTFAISTVVCVDVDRFGVPFGSSVLTQTCICSLSLAREFFLQERFLSFSFFSFSDSHSVNVSILEVVSGPLMYPHCKRILFVVVVVLTQDFYCLPVTDPFRCTI